MKLAPADIDPHIGEPGVHVGVARQPEPLDVEQVALHLVGDLQVDMLEPGDVAEILGLAVVVLRHQILLLIFYVIATAVKQSRDNSIEIASSPRSSQ